jgi:hypothetical protein
MASPTGSQIHVDRPLTNISIAYMWERGTAPFGLVADRVFPVVGVPKRSDVYYTYPKGAWFQGGSAKRGPGTESKGVNYRLSTDSYFCDVWALHKDVPWQDEANADVPLNLREDAAKFVTQNMLIQREIEWASKYFTTGVWATDKVGGTDFDKWSVYSSSDPGETIEEYKKLVERTTGFAPNTLVVGRDVHSKLKYHPLIKDQYKHTSDSSITPQMIARVFEIDRYMVAGGIRNTAEQTIGTETDTGFEFVVGSDDALLVYSNPNPGLMMPSGGYTFSWTSYAGGAFAAPTFERFNIDERKVTRIEGELAYVHKLVAGDMGVFLSDVVD